MWNLLLTFTQWPVRHDGFRYCHRFRYRLLCCRDYNSIQRQGCTNCYFCGFYLGGFRTRGSPLGRDTSVRTFCVYLSDRFTQENIVRLFKMSIAAKRMAAQNVLVKDLQGVEPLGGLPRYCDLLTGIDVVHRFRMRLYSFIVRDISNNPKVDFARHGQDWYSYKKPNDCKLTVCL